MIGTPLPIIQDAKHNNGLRWTREGLKRSIERNIPAEELYVALNSPKAELLENFPASENPTCLILGWDANDRAIHTVVAYSKMLVVTVYEPGLPKYLNPWERA